MTLTNGQIRNYCGPVFAVVENYRYIRQYCGPILYEIEGSLTQDELMMLITYIFILKEV